MNNKPKKASVKKKNKGIEFSLGGSSVTKYEIMTAIAKKYSIYGSTVWLNTPVQSEGGKTPAELMIDGQLSLVKKLIDESNGKIST